MPYKSKDKEREYARFYQKHLRKKNPTFNMFHLAKARAKRKGILFSLSQNDLRIPEVCPVLGIPLFFGGARNNAPSLDRVDNAKGYTKDNIRIISTKANQLKSNATLDQLEKIIAYIKDHNESCG